MTPVAAEKLDRIIERFAHTEAQLSAGATGEAFVRLSKDYAEIEPTARIAQALRTAYQERRDVEEMIAGGDPELAEMARAEKGPLAERIARLEQEMRILLLPKDAADDRNVILEIRAGTGGG